MEIIERGDYTLMYDKDNGRGYKKIVTLDEDLKEITSWIPFGAVTTHHGRKRKDGTTKVSNVYQFTLKADGKQICIRRALPNI